MSSIYNYYCRKLLISGFYIRTTSNRISKNILIMAKTSTYLNFPGQTEEVFNFYKSIFGGEFCGGGIMRFGDIPAQEGMPPMAEDVKNLVMHI